MIYTKENQAFLETIARTETGLDLLRVFKNFEDYYADIRNLGEVDPKIRVDALRLIKEGLIDKLTILSGESEEPEQNEHV